jgi:hypothetical protein
MISTYSVLDSTVVKYGRKASLCLCSCGKQFTARQSDLKRGQVSSCGCKLRRHGLRKHMLYSVWRGMMHRCHIPTTEQYEDYGGRGIFVCDAWHDVRKFVEDIETEIGVRPTGMQIDRVNNNKGYQPGNVKWSTSKENCRNTRRNHLVTIGSETRCASEWAEVTHIHVQTILWRIRNGKTGIDIITPAKKKRHEHN